MNLATIQDLTCEERVRHILYYSSYYGCDGNRLRCLIFCSRVEEAAYWPVCCKNKVAVP